MSSVEEEKPLVDLKVASATIIPAPSDDALHVFDKPTHHSVAYDTTNLPPPPPVNSSMIETTASIPSATAPSAVFEKEKKRTIVLGSIHTEHQENTNTANQQSPKRSNSPRVQIYNRDNSPSKRPASPRNAAAAAAGPGSPRNSAPPTSAFGRSTTSAGNSTTSKPEKPTDVSAISAQTDDTPIFKVREPSEQLMKTTAARVKDSQMLEERKKKKEEEVARRQSMNSSPRRQSAGGEGGNANNAPVTTTTPTQSTWTPSERLLKPTQARIMDVKEWEAHKERSKYEDDIWWELRKPAETAKHNPNTPSKLFEPTASFAKSVRPKHSTGNESGPESPEKKKETEKPHHLPAKINQDSPLLKTTKATKVQAWKSEIVPPEPPKPHLELLGAQTGPQHIESKIFYDTQSSRAQKWKSKEQIEREKQAEHAKKTESPGGGSGKKVKQVSSRLLELNESLKVSARTKVEKHINDPREAGWQPIHGKSHIPTIEEMHEHLVRLHGGNSTIASESHRDSSGSALNSHDQEDENGHHVYPDEEHHEEEVEEDHHENAQEEEEAHEEVDPADHDEEVHQELTQAVQSLEVN